MPTWQLHSAKVEKVEKRDAKGKLTGAEFPVTIVLRPRRLPLSGRPSDVITLTHTFVYEGTGIYPIDWIETPQVEAGRTNISVAVVVCQAIGGNGCRSRMRSRKIAIDLNEGTWKPLPKRMPWCAWVP